MRAAPWISAASPRATPLRQVADILQAHGVTSAVVSLGGNVYVCGAKPDGIRVERGHSGPHDSSGYAATVALTDCFAVTSGGYQRYYVAEDGTGVPAHH